MASVNDVLADTLADSLNKKFKDTKVAYFLDGSDSTPTDIKDFISTGSSMLDLAISNKPNGGIAVGRITEINGLESSGKSLLGAHILAETQKKGGVALPCYLFLYRYHGLLRTHQIGLKSLYITRLLLP